MNYQDYFSKKICVVTGAASGIGFAVSEALLKAGATVIMADRNTKNLSESLERLAIHGGHVHSMTVDVSKEEQVRHMIEDTAARHGRLDVLFNNAGIPASLPIGDATLDMWRKVIDVNLWSVIYGIHYVLPIMRKQGGGHIVNTSSIAGLLTPAYQSVYSATKFAVAGMSECLRFELGDENIHVSVVCPGNVASRIFGTPVFGEVIEAKIPDDAISAEEAAEIILKGVANKEGIIAFPEKYRQMWLQYWSNPKEAEKGFREEARKRRKAIEATGTIYQ